MIMATGLRQTIALRTLVKSLRIRLLLGHHVANCGALLGPVKALRYASTPLRGADGLDGILVRAPVRHLRDGAATKSHQLSECGRAFGVVNEEA
jgi:hypothetical protein